MTTEIALLGGCYKFSFFFENMSYPSWRPVLNWVCVDIRFERTFPNLKYFKKLYIGYP